METTTEPKKPKKPRKSAAEVAAETGTLRPDLPAKGAPKAANGFKAKPKTETLEDELADMARELGNPPPRPKGRSEVIRLDALDVYPRNPRGPIREEDVVELMSDIGTHGQLHELTVRPKRGERGEERWEVLAGARRRLAMILGGHTTARCWVLDGCDDDTAREIVLTENAQREDIHPLDEADSIRELMELKGSAEAVAARLGKTVAHVHGRLRLAGLGAEGREAFRAGELTFGVAAALARFDEPTQARALREGRAAWPPRPPGEPIPSASITSALVRAALLLSGAKFPLDVVPDAKGTRGACTTCMHRTGAQTELFADALAATKDDRCVDHACWDAKNAWWFAELAAKAKEQGATVKKKLDAKAYAGTPLWNGSDLRTADYVPADAPANHGHTWDRIKSGNRELTWSQAHKKAFGEPIPATEITVTLDGTGAPREVIKESLAKRIRSAFKKGETGGDTQPDSYAQQEKKRREKEKIQRAVLRAVQDAAIQKARSVDLTEAEVFGPGGLLRPLALLALDRLDSPTLVDLGIRECQSYLERHKALVEHVASVKSDEELVRLLLVGLLVRTFSRDRTEEGESARAAALELLGVDADAIKRDVEAAAKKPKKASSKTIAATTAKRGKRKA
jgi:ParB/RepB/Spo0J family partition protein